MTFRPTSPAELRRQQERTVTQALLAKRAIGQISGHMASAPDEQTEHYLEAIAQLSAHGLRNGMATLADMDEWIVSASNGNLIAPEAARAFTDYLVAIHDLWEG